MAQALFRMFGYSIGLQASLRKTRKNKFVVGYTNRCESGAYIVFLDYDNTELKWVEEELSRLQEQHCLSNFYVFRSGVNNYHAVCFDKVTIHKYLKILKSSSVDSNYIDVPLYWGKKIWTLRTCSKGGHDVKFVDCYPSKWEFRSKSKAHIKLIENLFSGVMVNKYNQDDSKKIILARYPI